MNTVHTNISAVIAYQIAGTSTEYARWLIFLQHDLIIIQIYFQLILLYNIQGTAKLNRQNDSSQLINFTNDSSRFHLIPKSFL